MKKLWMGVALAAALGAAVPSVARGPMPSSASEGDLVEETAPKAEAPKSCFARLASLGKMRVPGWVSAIVIGAMIGPPVVDQTIQHSLHHDVAAVVSGDRHLGNGIYFDDRDWAIVLDALTPGERALLEASPRDELAIVKMFTGKVFGDYDESRIPGTEITAEDKAQGIEARRYHHYPLGIRGSHFVVARGQPRGNCEHKARVLNELLRRAGFASELERGMLKEGVAHAYTPFRLSDGSEWIADGTEGSVEPAGRYRDRNVAYRIDYFGRPWPAPGK